MANSQRPEDDRSVTPAGVETGAQSGPSGVGGEPRGAAMQARDEQEHTGTTAPQAPARRSGHASDPASPGYRARPAGESGLGAQDEASALDQPQGEGNYLATDQGDKPLRNG